MDRLGFRLVRELQYFLHPFASPHDEPAASVAQSLVEIDEALAQESEPVRAAVRVRSSITRSNTNAGTVRSTPRVAAAKHRVVVHAQVAREQSDRGAHGASVRWFDAGDRR